MPGILHQVWTLVEKNLKVAVRRPISTTIRALIRTIAIFVIVYAQYLFNATSRSSGGRNSIALVGNGLIAGEYSAVIEDVATPFRKAGKWTHRVADYIDPTDTCRALNGGQRAVMVQSFVKGGDWNYTIRFDALLKGRFDVRSLNDNAPVYFLPLGRAFDIPIASRLSPQSEAHFNK
ncbi:MAG: hypothetical protein Q9171_002583 [Xanthocarpia ochracea]